SAACADPAGHAPRRGRRARGREARPPRPRLERLGQSLDAGADLAFRKRGVAEEEAGAGERPRVGGGDRIHADSCLGGARADRVELAWFDVVEPHHEMHAGILAGELYTAPEMPA